jgi:hypothetical protein
MWMKALFVFLSERESGVMLDIKWIREHREQVGAIPDLGFGPKDEVGRLAQVREASENE